MILTVTIHPALDRILLVERLLASDINRVQVLMEYGGGKGNNVARALSRLGVEALAFGFQGGEIGRLATKIFKKEGIPTHFIPCKKPTRISTLLINQANGERYTLYEPGQFVTEKEKELLKSHFSKIIGGFQVALFCGSAQQSAASLFKELIEIAKQKGVVCIVDSSGEALRQAIDAAPFMVKVNQQELSEYIGKTISHSAELIAGIEQVHQKGVDVVAVSVGEEGLWVSDRVSIWHATLSVDHVINDMGCGDSLLAGIGYAILNKHNLVEIAKWGVACGTANTQALGAGFIEKNIVEEFLPQVQVRQIQ